MLYMKSNHRMTIALKSVLFLRCPACLDSGVISGLILPVWQQYSAVTYSRRILNPSAILLGLLSGLKIAAKISRSIVAFSRKVMFHKKSHSRAIDPMAKASPIHSSRFSTPSLLHLRR